MSNTKFAESFSIITEKFANEPVLIDKNSSTGKVITYEELNDLVDRCLTFFDQEANVGKSDTILVSMPNSIELLICFLAAMKGGYTFVPVMDTSTENEFKRTLLLTNPQLCILSSPDEKQVMLHDGDIINHVVKIDSRFEWLPEKPILRNDYKDYSSKLLVTSSGTTGEPKAIVIDGDKLWSSAIDFSSYHHLKDKSLRFWNYLPMSYIGGLYNLFLVPLTAGGSVVIDKPFDGETFLSYWDTVQKYSINTLWFVPTIIHGLMRFAKRLNEDERLLAAQNVRKCFLGTAPISLSAKEEFEKTFNLQLLENYGLSETVVFVSSEHTDNVHLREEGSIGQPLPSIKLKFKNHKEDEDATEGFNEICVKSPFLFEGYLKSNGKLDPALDADGYYRTGDLGKLTPNGNLVITGRVKDIIKKGGYMVSLSEIEYVALQHSIVSEAAAVKKNHPFYGESCDLYIVVAEVESNDRGAIVRDVEKYIQEQLVKYKWPEKVMIIDQIPKTSSGKIQKFLIDKGGDVS